MRLILIAQKTMMPTCKIPINQGVINIGTPTIPTNRSIKRAGGPTHHSDGRGPPQPRGPASSATDVTEKSHANRIPLLKRQRIRGGYQDPPPLSSRRLSRIRPKRCKSSMDTAPTSEGSKATDSESTSAPTSEDAREESGLSLRDK